MLEPTHGIFAVIAWRKGVSRILDGIGAMFGRAVLTCSGPARDDVSTGAQSVGTGDMTYLSSYDGIFDLTPVFLIRAGSHGDRVGTTNVGGRAPLPCRLRCLSTSRALRLLLAGRQMRRVLISRHDFEVRLDWKVLARGRVVGCTTVDGRMVDLTRLVQVWWSHRQIVIIESQLGSCRR